MGKVNSAGTVTTVKNTGSGPALALITKSTTSPPFSTNAKGLVSNLYAQRAKTANTLAGKALAQVRSGIDAATVGGVSLGGLVKACAPTGGQRGAVVGVAEIVGSGVTASWSTSMVYHSFLCTGEQIQARTKSIGSYQVMLGNVAHGNATGIAGGVPLVSSTVSDRLASVSGPFQCANPSPPYEICYIVSVRTLAGAPAAGSFTFMTV